MADVGLVPADLCPWNAYPWAFDPKTDGSLGVEHIAQGAVVLGEVIDPMQDLHVVLLQGEQARWAWAMLAAFDPQLLERGLVVVPTCHPLGTRGRTPEAAMANKARQRDEWAAVARAIGR